MLPTNDNEYFFQSYASTIQDTQVSLIPQHLIITTQTVLSRHSTFSETGSVISQTQPGRPAVNHRKMNTSSLFREKNAAVLPEKSIK